MNVAVGVAIVLGSIWSVVQSGVLGAAAFIVAVIALYKAVRWLYRVANQVSNVHAVILGSGEDVDGTRIPSLVERLESTDVHLARGAERMARIEDKADDTNRRVHEIEDAMKLLADDERQQIRKAITLASVPRTRREGDPPVAADG